MPRFFRYAILSTILATVTVSYSQGKSSRTLDSLNNVLETHTARDAERVRTILRIADRIFTVNPDRALKLLAESETIADETRFAKGKAYSLQYTANALIVKGKYNTAMPYIQRSLTEFEALGNKSGMGDCYHNFGRCHYYLGDYDDAAAEYKKAIAIGEEANDTGRITASLCALGVLYAKQSNTAQALECYKRALKIGEKVGDKSAMGTALVNMGNLLKNSGDYPAALDYLQRGVEMKRQIGDEQGVAAGMEGIGTLYSMINKGGEASEYLDKTSAIVMKTGNRAALVSTYINKGVVYQNSEEFAKARSSFNAALKLSKELCDDFSIAVSHSNLGTLDILTKKYDAALRHFQEAARIHQKLNNGKELAYVWLKMGRAYYFTEQYDKALEYADKGAALSDKLKLLGYQKDISLLRSDIYYAQKNYKLAYESQQRHQLLMDSILKKDIYNNVADVKYKHAYQAKLNSSESRAKALKNEVVTKEDALNETRMQRAWWVGGSVCLLILLGVGAVLFRDRKIKLEKKQLLTEQKLHRSQMNPHFIFNSIQNVRSLISSNQETEAVDYLNQFSKLTRQILESSDENYTSLEEEIELIRNYISIQQLLYSNSFEFDINVDESIDPESVFLPPMLTQPFIENAIKHGLASKANGGRLVINFSMKGDRLFFEVSDNGAGFSSVPKTEGHKSMAMEITRKRLVNYTNNPDFHVQSGNIFDGDENIIGAKVAFEIPYIFEA